MNSPTLSLLELVVKTNAVILAEVFPPGYAFHASMGAIVTAPVDELFVCENQFPFEPIRPLTEVFSSNKKSLSVCDIRYLKSERRFIGVMSNRDKTRFIEEPVGDVVIGFDMSLTTGYMVAPLEFDRIESLRHTRLYKLHSRYSKRLMLRPNDVAKTNFVENLGLFFLTDTYNNHFYTASEVDAVALSAILDEIAPR